MASFKKNFFRTFEKKVTFIPFLERGREGERNIDAWLPPARPSLGIWDPGTCPKLAIELATL